MIYATENWVDAVIMIGLIFWLMDLPKWIIKIIYAWRGVHPPKEEEEE